MMEDEAGDVTAFVGPPDPVQLMRYVEDMLLELAQLSSAAGETALAASLAIAAIQAGAAGDRRRSEAG